MTTPNIRRITVTIFHGLTDNTPPPYPIPVPRDDAKSGGGKCRRAWEEGAVREIARMTLRRKIDVRRTSVCA